MNSLKSVKRYYKRISSGQENATTGAMDYTPIVNLIEQYQKRKNNKFSFKESFNFRIARKINFDELCRTARFNRKIFNSFLQDDMDKFEQIQKVNGNAVNFVLKDLETEDFKYADCIQSGSVCRDFYYDTTAVQEFAKMAYYCNVANESDNVDNISTINGVAGGNRLTHPQKIILLDKLGVFNAIGKGQYTNAKRDEIVSLLIEEDETNTRKYINGLTAKEKAGRYNPYKNKGNETVVNRLLGN
jgi:hypothetical protein